ncbi:MAG TPA: GTP 3',8-cyclase MoaA [Nitrososphaera sp.]|nr:GTP 3',8-cyclase MoaA [Nitrososphaera sp.]
MGRGHPVAEETRQILPDKKGRVARKLRISVTDRCNFSCLFCMPSRSNIHWISDAELLTFDEITRITRLLCSLGIKKVRITGGEPLLREGIETLVGSLSRIKGIESIDMTTNGWFLSLDKARELRRAGLHGITVSLHSMKRDRFAKISGTDGLQRVIDSIDAAREAGLSPIKINTVAISGYNDDEIIDFVNFARDRSLSLRFIEFMPLDGLNAWSPEMVLSGRQILDIISKKHYKLRAQERKPGDTATVYGFEGDDESELDGRGFKGDIGLITPVSKPFCDDCDRIRLTADGKLLTCLFDTNYYDLKPYMRNKESDAYKEQDPMKDLDLLANSNFGVFKKNRKEPNRNRHRYHQQQRRKPELYKGARTAALEEDCPLAEYITKCIEKKPPGIAYMMPLTLERMHEKRPRAMHAIGG